MENQENQNPQNQTQAQASVEPVVPVETQPTQASVVTASGGSKKMLYVLIVVAILILAAAVLYFVMGVGKKTAVVSNPNVTNQQITATPTPTPTGAVTPIQNPSDLNGALNQINGVDTSSVGAQLNQNASDSSTFSQ